MTPSTYTDAQLRHYARKIAAAFRAPRPRTAADVARFTGEPYTGRAPRRRPLWRR